MLASSVLRSLLAASFWIHRVGVSFRLVVAWCGEAPFLYLSYFFGAQSLREGASPCRSSLFLLSAADVRGEGGCMHRPRVTLSVYRGAGWERMREMCQARVDGCYFFLWSTDETGDARRGGCMRHPRTFLSFLWSTEYGPVLYGRCAQRTDVRRLDIHTFVVPTLFGLFPERRGGCIRGERVPVSFSGRADGYMRFSTAADVFLRGALWLSSTLSFRS